MKKSTLQYLFIFLVALHYSNSAVSQQLVNYLTNQSSETIYAEVSQESVVSGETLWFKVLVVNGARFISQNLSKVAYVELVSPEGKAVLQAKILLEHGSGNGSWIIPNSVSGGVYKLMVYTRWAKSFGNTAIFTKTIQIINPNKYDPNAAKELPTNSKSYVLFEGQSFVAGLKNNLYFTANENTPYYLLKNNSLVDSSSSNDLGIGQFSIVAEKTALYSIKNGISGQITNLPKPTEEGWHFEVTSIKDNSLNLQIQRTALASGSPTFYVVVHANQEIIEAQQFSSSELNFSKTLKISSSFTGLASVTLLDANKIPVAGNTILVQNTRIGSAGISIDKATYKTREKGSFVINGLDSTSLANITVRIRKIDVDLPKDEDDPSFYFMYLSRLAEMPKAHQAFLRTNHANFEKVKPLLILYGTPTLSNSAPLNYAPELSGHIISGTIKNRKTMEPAAGIKTYLTIPGERFYFNYAQSDKEGRFAFDVKRCFGVESFIIQTNNLKDSGYVIEIDNPFLSHTPFSTGTNPNAGENESVLLKRIQNAQIQNGINSIRKDQYFLPNYNDSTPFFGKADMEYNLEDYTRFTTMEEILREYVVEVDVKKTSNGFRLRVLNVPFKELFLEDPLVLYDGVPIFDMAKVMALDPLKIRKLEVVSRRFLLGAHAFDGVISLTSMKRDLEGLQLDPRALVVEYQGLQLQRQFSSPNYGNKEVLSSRQPDLRTLLQWEPETLVYQKKQHTVNFSTSDLTGAYIIEVSGITGNGTIIYTTQKFSVTE